MIIEDENAIAKMLYSILTVFINIDDVLRFVSLYNSGGLSVFIKPRMNQCLNTTACMTNS